MPYLLLRHAPLLSRKADCWLVEVDQLFNDERDHLLQLSDLQRKGHRVAEIRVECAFVTLPNATKTKVVRSALELRDIWWPAFFIVCQLDTTYEIKDSFRQNPKLKRFPAKGGQDLASRVCKANLSQALEVSETKAVVYYAEVDGHCFAQAVEDIEDRKDHKIVQLITNPDAVQGEKVASEWCEELEKELQKMLDMGVTWEDAILKLRVDDSSLFVRSQVR